LDNNGLSRAPGKIFGFSFANKEYLGEVVMNENIRNFNNIKNPTMKDWVSSFSVIKDGKNIGNLASIVEFDAIRQTNANKGILAANFIQDFNFYKKVKNAGMKGAIKGLIPDSYDTVNFGEDKSWGTIALDSLPLVQSYRAGKSYKVKPNKNIHNVNLLDNVKNVYNPYMRRSEPKIWMNPANQ
jgi:hypothetical protein